jgi:hypothetical protein
MLSPFVSRKSKRYDKEKLQEVRKSEKERKQKNERLTMSANILQTLQAHQLVLQRELVEISADLEELQTMSSRYFQSQISFQHALEQLSRLRNDKEIQLGQVTKQIENMEASLQASALLVNELQRPTGGNSAFSNHYGGNSFNSQSAGQGFGSGGYTNTSNFAGGGTQAGTGIGLGFGGTHSHSHNQGSPSVQMSVLGSNQRPTISTVTTDATTFGGHRPVVPLVTLANPQGLVVTTNSTILTHSPQRSRLM